MMDPSLSYLWEQIATGIMRRSCNVDHPCQNFSISDVAADLTFFRYCKGFDVIVEWDDKWALEKNGGKYVLLRNRLMQTNRRVKSEPKIGHRAGGGRHRRADLVKPIQA